jgi:hypothetical protein
VTTYDVGDGVNLRYLATDADGNAVDATMALAIISLATGIQVATPSVGHTATGQYDAVASGLAAGDYAYVWTVTGAISDVATGVFTVATHGPASYTTLPAVKASLGKVTADDRDENITLAIVAASRMIDASTGRWPGAFQADTTVSTRVFNTAGRVLPVSAHADHAGSYLRSGAGYMRTMVMVDDIASTTGLIVELGNIGGGTYGTVTGPNFGPDNALAMGQPIQWIGIPYTALLGTIDSIRVTARWGWPSIPAEVEMATRLLASRLYKRKDSPQGVIASADWGAVRVSRTDPDVYALIHHLSIAGFA